MFKKFLFLIIFTLGAFSIFYMKDKLFNKQDTLVFATSSLPFSSDPMDYDAYVHHYAFTSLLGNLVSSSKKGELFPMIAKSWTRDSEGKHWEFILRNDLRYSNGDKVTAEDYALCLKRIAFLKKKTKSNSGVFEYLRGFDSIKSLKEVEGINFEGDKLIFDFKEPINDLPLKISFGFYSLVHPSLYDHNTGEWFSKKSIISSNAYELKDWSENQFVLQLRKGIPYVNYSTAIKNVKIVNFTKIHEAKDLAEIDFAVADKNSLMFDSSFEYIGSNEGFIIGYVECYDWKNPNNPMHELTIRKWLRYKFYEGLEKGGMSITTSFFPAALLNLKEQNFDFKASRPEFKHFSLVTHTMSRASKIKENSNKKSVQEIMDQGLKNLGQNSGIDISQIDYDESMEIEKVLGLAINGTGIDADEIVDTVKFMFSSKQGANLPDLNGKILKELEKENPNIEMINTELWNQAIIWPVRHYSKGHWFNKNRKFNFEQLNMNIPAIDFQFIRGM